MVLQGNQEGFSPPFDSSLYGSSFSSSTPGKEYTIEYEGCEAVSAFFTTTPDVKEVLPEGVELFSDPPQAGVLLARYPFSTVGEYNEFISVVQVEHDGGMAYYIPYIYVTNDAAMAAGRELAGAPKKIADIGLKSSGDAVQGRMERPEGRRLFTVTSKPEKRAKGNIVNAVLPSPTPLLSVRHLPPIEGGDGLTQLVEWYADIDFHTDEEGERKMWLGPTSVSYDSHSKIDPVHKVEVEEMMTGFYAQFDMELGVTSVEKEWNP
ncbi:MAG: acetoacetate decarboxylase family protein [Halobacteria archaeon]|nr:acetoacetate decarboxylase family protein [Halobacteria archaeon]